MIGYVQLYFKIAGEKEVYYACFDGDFGKPLTRFRLWTLKNSMKRLYERFDKIYSVEFCTKEEWQKDRSENEINVGWGDESKGR